MDKNTRIAKELVRLAKSLAGGYYELPSSPPSNGFDDWLDDTGLFSKNDKNYANFLEDLRKAGWEGDEPYEFEEKDNALYAFVKVRPLSSRIDGNPPVEFKYLFNEPDPEGYYYIEEDYSQFGNKTGFNVADAFENSLTFKLSYYFDNY